MKKSLLSILFLFLLAGCGPYARYTSVESYPKAEASEESKIDQVKLGRIIESYLGTPFRKEGNSKLGIDCSGLVFQVYEEYASLNLPRNTYKLYQSTQKIEKEKLSFGDLVFFSETGRQLSHVGIYVGNNRFVHASETQGVIISSLAEDYYQKRFRAATRVIFK